MSEKTEQPTARRLREARRKGQVAKSRLFTSAIVTLGGLVGLLSFSDVTAARLTGWASLVLSHPASLSPAGALRDAVTLLAVMVAPVLGGALMASMAISVSNAGLQLNLGHVTPQLKRIDPFQGAKKLFSPRQAIEVLKGLAVAAVLSFVVWQAIREGAAAVIAGINRDGGDGFRAVLLVLGPAVRRAAIVLVVLGALDFLWARRRHTKDLMMTRQEVKREHHSSEGDPHHKAKRKQAHLQLAFGGPARGVQKATAVVVNPTHIAVAIRYDDAECDAPYLVAKGREEDALKLRKQAEALGIPIVRDVPLARALVHYDVGEEVPEELYKAAAVVLKVAMEKTESLKEQTR